MPGSYLLEGLANFLQICESEPRCPSVVYRQGKTIRELANSVEPDYP